MLLLSDGKVLINGGFRGQSDNALNSTEIFDPITKLWTLGNNMNQSRSSHSASLLPDGNFLIEGGDLHFDAHTRTSEIYNVSSGT